MNPKLFGVRVGFPSSVVSTCMQVTGDVQVKYDILDHQLSRPEVVTTIVLAEASLSLRSSSKVKYQ